MECRMRKWGVVPITQNVSNQNRVRWIILKPWILKQWSTKTFLNNNKQNCTFWPFCATDRQRRTHTIYLEWVYTHISVRCTAVNIMFSNQRTWRNCRTHVPLIGRQTSYTRNKFFIAQQSSRGPDSTTFCEESISPSRRPLWHQSTGS